jgi:tRNA(adenine34) deaminase
MKYSVFWLPDAVRDGGKRILIERPLAVFFRGFLTTSRWKSLRCYDGKNPSPDRSQLIFLPDDWSPLDLPFTDPRHPLHVHHMELALQEAEAAAAEDEVPIGCAIVSLERGIIGLAHNQREKLKDPTAHAEMIAITQAAQALSSWRLENCILYVTLEPCPMCAGAIVLARLPMVVYGAVDPKAGACDTLYHITSDPRLNHRAQVVSGVMAERCAAVLSEFFTMKRRQRNV